MNAVIPIAQDLVPSYFVATISISLLTAVLILTSGIDKSFIDNITDESAVELSKTIITIGQQLSLTVVAEGTASVEQVKLLSEMGCQAFQGYYFSRPLSGNAVTNWRMPSSER
jgi:EAL domain-containing protein (putative c-di-GMP-specific phosphodiesterase class I)